MINEVIVFTGSKKDFNRLLHERIDKENDEVVSFMELIQHYNARIHPTESGVKEIFLKNKIGANCFSCELIDPCALASSKKLIVFSCHLECGTKRLISQGAGFDVYAFSMTMR